MKDPESFSNKQEAEELFNGGQESVEFLLALDDNKFVKVLKEFCHFYQIPFIENNVRKTAYDAAKIYYKLEEDSINIPVKFNWIASHLSSIPKNQVEDLETNYRMRDKWMKFFQKGIQKMEFDQDAALCFPKRDYIEEYFRTELTDYNLIRAYEALINMKEKSEILLADNILRLLRTKLKSMSFEINSPDTISYLLSTIREKFTFYIKSDTQGDGE